MKFQNFILLAFTCFLLSCLPEAEGPYADNRFIKDQYGRTLILHGLNTASNAKSSEDHMPNLVPADIDREVQWGFNAVRLLTFWEAIEPDSGYYDETYFNNFEERVNWYTERGMYVIVDFHQDIYSRLFGGSGFPEWTIFTNGIPIPEEPVTPWWLNALNPAVEAAHRNFWQNPNYSWLQDRYILMLQEMINRVKDNPMVIGYDIMNEPHSGNIQKTLNTNFEKGQLKRFYDKAVAGIREVDQEKYIFYEPQSLLTNSGLLSHLPKVEDVRAGDPRMVYSPHCYPLFQDFGNGDYNQSAEDNVALWEYHRSLELDRHQTPMLIGEFAVRTGTDNFQGYQEYLKDMLDVADRLQSNWTYWSNDKNGTQSPTNEDGSENPMLNFLIRTYPQAIAGRLLDFSFDYENLAFELKYINNTSISMPTEIYIPQRFYEGEWDLEVIGTDNWTESWNSERQILSISSTDNNQEITIKINPS